MSRQSDNHSTNYPPSDPGNQPTTNSIVSARAPRGASHGYASSAPRQDAPSSAASRFVLPVVITTTGTVPGSQSAVGVVFLRARGQGRHSIGSSATASFGSDLRPERFVMASLISRERPEEAIHQDADAARITEVADSEESNHEQEQSVQADTQFASSHNGETHSAESANGTSDAPVNEGVGDRQTHTGSTRSKAGPSKLRRAVSKVFCI